MQNFLTSLVSRFVAALATLVTPPKKAALDARVEAFVIGLEADANEAAVRAEGLEDVAANLAASAVRERRYAKHAKAIASVVEAAPRA